MIPRYARVPLIAVAVVALLGIRCAGAWKDGEVLIRYRPGKVTRAITAQSRAASTLAGARVTRSIEQIRTHRVRLPHGVSVAEAVARYSKDPNVEYAGPNHIISICIEPNDEYFHDEWIGYYWQWGLYSDLNPEAGIDAPDAWDITTGSASIVIAVVDTGVDNDHEDLIGKLVPGYNCITGQNPTVTQDDHGHGTFTAGVAAANTNNMRGVAGVSWGAKIMPIKALDATGYGLESDAAAGIIWAADNGAHIINMSMGGYDDVPSEKAAIEYAYGKGCVLVGASGNDGLGTAFYPASYEQVIAVGASNEAMQRCSEADWLVGGSNYGAYLDVVAPGNNIQSTWWDYEGGTYQISSGTSAAAPFVAGIAALVLTVHPTWTPDQVASQIKLTAKDIESSGWDMYTGYGIASAYRALTVQPATPIALGNIASIPDSTQVRVTGAVVTSGTNEIPGRIYVEQADRSCAIACTVSSGVGQFVEGDIVEVSGSLGNVHGERAIRSAMISKTASGDPLRPLGIRNAWVGGGPLGYRGGVTNGSALNNLSLLVTTWGEVTSVGWTYFYLDDGNHIEDGSGMIGLKIACTTLTMPSKGSRVRVTGIASAEEPEVGVIIPVVKPRRQSDISDL